jgi:hypothetical protein
MKRLLFSFLALILCTQALAQTPGQWGPDGEQTVSYPAIPNVTELNKVRDRILPVNGDGSNAWGGTPPAASYQPAAIDNPVVLSDGMNSTGGNITGTDEEKFRTVCNIGFTGTFDPLRGPGQNPFGHPHMFYGNAGTNASSTYSTLRSETGTATCPGRHLNNTAYWAPMVLKDNAYNNDGVTRGKRPDEILLYYIANEDMAYENEYTFFLRGHGDISGMNMDYPGAGSGSTAGVPDYVVTELAAANATNNYASWQATDQRVTWKCEGGSFTTAKWLATSAGADALGNCPSTAQITASVQGPTCWDGHNLTSGGGGSSPSVGYKHMRYAFRESSNAVTDVCPTGWYKIPTILVRLVFSHQGASDYTTWYCSSDAAASTAAGRTMNKCESLHVDRWLAWDERASDLFQAECIGAKGGTYWGACNDSSVSQTGPKQLITTDITGGHTYAGDQLGDWMDVPAMGGGGSMGYKSRIKLHKKN